MGHVLRQGANGFSKLALWRDFFWWNQQINLFKKSSSWRPKHRKCGMQMYSVIDSVLAYVNTIRSSIDVAVEARNTKEWNSYADAYSAWLMAYS
eukprot:6298484-Karenia_brevis.AAC.1